MNQYTFLDGVSPHLSYLFNGIKMVQKLLNLHVSRLLSSCLLMLLVLCTGYSSELAAKKAMNPKCYTNNLVTITGYGGQELAKCCPTTHAMNSTSDRHLFCSGPAGAEGNLFSNKHPFYVPDHLFPDGSERDVRICKIFENGTDYKGGTTTPTDYAFFKCIPPSPYKTRLSHAFYYAGNLVKNNKPSIYSSMRDQDFDCQRYGKGFYCQNFQIQRHFLPEEPTVAINAVEEATKRIESELSYIENSDGTVKPWPFQEILVIADEHPDSSTPDFYVCNLDASRSNIFGAQYTCSTFSSFMLEYITNLTTKLCFYSVAICVVTSLIRSYWHERKLAQNTSNILNKNCNDTVDTNAQPQKVGYWWNPIARWKNRSKENEVYVSNDTLPCDIEDGEEPESSSDIQIVLDTLPCDIEDGEEPESSSDIQIVLDTLPCDIEDEEEPGSSSDIQIVLDTLPCDIEDEDEEEPESSKDVQIVANALTM